MWFIFDALGIFLALLTWVLIFFADWVVTRHVLATLFGTSKPRFAWLPYTDFGYVVFIVYQSLLTLSWISHLRAMTADPGTVGDSQPPDGFQNPRICKLCQGRWKPPRAHHCKKCRRCIFRMDHHCPWVNNCVGLANQKLFILFLSYTALSAIMTLVLLVCSGVYWLWSQKSLSDAAQPGSMMMVCSGIVAVECLAAILFVGDFLQEQIESIQMNSTLVETYQRTHGERTGFWNHFRDIFGHSYWNWPWPYPSAPPPLYTEPAIHDDADTDNVNYGDEDSLGIAGEDSEASANGIHAEAYSDMPQGPMGLREESAPRPRHKYIAGEAPE